MTPVETIEEDVLCAGGGIAGLMAAIRAADLGARVVVAEKGNILTSGVGVEERWHCDDGCKSLGCGVLSFGLTLRRHWKYSLPLLPDTGNNCCQIMKGGENESGEA